MIEPTWKENQFLAFDRWERRGGGDGYDKFDWYEARRDLILAKNYTLAAHYQLSGKDKYFIGQKENRRCRFCGRERALGEQRNPFKIEAHAVPEFLGNESLITYEECDACNILFSGSLENNLSEFINPVRTILGMPGKTGIPKYKSVISRIERTGARMEIRQYESDPIARMDPENNALHTPLTVKTFVPIALYKCLTKIAISIMEPADLPAYNDACAWVRATDHSHALECFKAHWGLFYFIPGPQFYENAWASLLRRNDDTALMPHMMFVIGCMNIIFMTMLPLSKKDYHLHGKSIYVPRFGLPTGPGCPFGTSSVQKIPFGSAEKVKGLPVNITHHVDLFHKTL